ncbi:MAG: HAD-IIB family hydrolase [Nocardioidaceae bacterium]
MSSAGWLPRLVATDLDGTLLRSDGSVSARTVQTLRAVQDARIQTVVVTARPPRWLHDLVDVIGDHGVAICSNGAFVYDVVNRQVLSERVLTRDVLQTLVGRLRRAIPSITFAVESSAGFGHEPAYDSIHPAPEGLVVADMDALLDPPPGKLLARAPDLDDEEFLARVIEVVGERAVVAFSGAGGLAEISAAGVTKAAVLADWCLERGIDATDVWAFGDMPNDLPMLTWAGASYAVANAHPDVLAAATHACPGNDEDGVAQVLDEMLGRVTDARL